MTTAEIIISLWAGTRGYLDKASTPQLSARSFGTLATLRPDPPWVYTWDTLTQEVSISFVVNFEHGSCCHAFPQGFTGSDPSEESNTELNSAALSRKNIRALVNSTQHARFVAPAFALGGL